MWLHNQDLIIGDALDYGCGRGMDAKTFAMTRWDPYHFPNIRALLKRWDTILCTYVLNVTPRSEERSIIQKVQGLLKPGGNAFFSVRRDIGKDHITSKGTLQRNVVLGYADLVRETPGYAIYRFGG